MGPKLRFQIFARDHFTCLYCGRKTPEVILEVDHVLPKSQGGTDELANLVTSCFECNRGKGASILEMITPETDLHEQAILIAERELQVREYNEVRRQQRDREDAEIDELMFFWESLRPERWHAYPALSTLRKWLRIIGLDDIKDAMEICAENKGTNNDALPYLYGICKNKSQKPGE